MSEFIPSSHSAVLIQRPQLAEIAADIGSNVACSVANQELAWLLMASCRSNPHDILTVLEDTAGDLFQSLLSGMLLPTTIPSCLALTSYADGEECLNGMRRSARSCYSHFMQSGFFDVLPSAHHHPNDLARLAKVLKLSWAELTMKGNWVVLVATAKGNSRDPVWVRLSVSFFIKKQERLACHPQAQIIEARIAKHENGLLLT